MVPGNIHVYRNSKPFWGIIVSNTCDLNLTFHDNWGVMWPCSWTHHIMWLSISYSMAPSWYLAPFWYINIIIIFIYLFVPEVHWHYSSWQLAYLISFLWLAKAKHSMIGNVNTPVTCPCGYTTSVVVLQNCVVASYRDTACVHTI